VNKKIKSLIKLELILGFLFLLIPFLLPITSGVLLASVSAYAHASNANVFIISLIILGYLIIVDGIIDNTRRYNIILGVLLLLVVAFPVGNYRLIHDLFAILFFIGNAFIITWHSKLIIKWLKLSLFALITITIGAFFMNFISLFIAEALGFLLLSFFMFLRYYKSFK
jgi:hypothetical protein